MGEDKRGELSSRESMSDKAIIEGFKKGEIPGQEIMRRVLDRTGLLHRASEVLIRGDGSPLLKPDGKPVLAEDYLDIAANHGGAVQMIIGFIDVDTSDTKFPDYQTFMRTIILDYLPEEES